MRTRRTQSPREQERKRRTRFALFMLAAAAVLVMPMLAVWLQAKLSRVPLDPDSLCPADRPTAAQFVLLVDATDAYSPVQKADAMKAFTRIQADVPENGRISVFALSPDSGENIDPIVSLCNPGSGRDRRRWNSRPERLYKRWKEEFRRPLRDLMVSLLETEPASSSPILAAIQAISVTGFDDGPGERRLYILSDLLQHDETYSQYSGKRSLRFEEFRSSGLLNRYLGNLDGVEVYIYYVRRDGMKAIQTREHVTFWEQYFNAVGASVASVEGIAG